MPFAVSSLDRLSSRRRDTIQVNPVAVSPYLMSLWVMAINCPEIFGITQSVWTSTALKTTHPGPL